jgi:hypothetical protein
MRTLVYLRTHSGDPDEEGLFGIHDCMDQVRCWCFEAVIGVGGMSAEARSWGIAGQVTWIGIGPQKHDGPHDAPLVTFDHFVYFGSDGLDFRAQAPTLARRMYRTGHHIRTVMDDLSAQEQAEVAKLLLLAAAAPPSPARASSSDDEDALASERKPCHTRCEPPGDDEEVEALPRRRKCRRVRLPDRTPAWRVRARTDSLSCVQPVLRKVTGGPRPRARS